MRQLRFAWCCCNIWREIFLILISFFNKSLKIKSFSFFLVNLWLEICNAFNRSLWLYSAPIKSHLLIVGYNRLRSAMSQKTAVCRFAESLRSKFDGVELSAFFAGYEFSHEISGVGGLRQQSFAAWNCTLIHGIHKKNFLLLVSISCLWPCKIHS